MMQLQQRGLWEAEPDPVIRRNFFIKLKTCHVGHGKTQYYKEKIKISTP
jgi:hypothetical protein